MISLPCHPIRIEFQKGQPKNCHGCLWENIDLCRVGVHEPAETRPCATCIRNKKLEVFRDVEPTWDHYRNYEEYMRKIDEFRKCPKCNRDTVLVSRVGNECTLKCDNCGVVKKTWKNKP